MNQWRKLLVRYDFFETIKKTVYLLSERKRRSGRLLILFAVIVSLIEVVGISLIMPFVQIAIDFNQIHSNRYFEYFFTKFSFESDVGFVIFFGVLLIAYYFFRSLMSIIYYYKIAEFSKECYHDISIKIFRKILQMKYRDFQEKNSSRIVQAIASEALNISYIIAALITMAGEAAVVMLIYALMLLVDWKTTLVLSLFLIFNAIVLKTTLTAAVKRSGLERARAQKGFYEILNSSFGNFKFIKLRTEEEKVSQRFETESRQLVKALTVSETIAHIPRLYLETIGFVIVLLMIVYWVGSTGSDVSGMMGVLSLFIIALYRMMPSFNRIISKYNQIIFMKPALDVVYEQLSHICESEKDEIISFNSLIEVKDISFSYEKKKPVLHHVSFEIQKGEKVAFVGESGGGKSTLVDLVMGLLEPDNGKIRVDGKVLNELNRKDWRRKFGYIPQDIYLFDASVAENVAFSVKEDVDRERVRKVLEQARILHFLENNMEGIDTMVGEKGVKLSGGQKQRIAIARALYHDPEILVLDEATSALDSETEREIMKEIYEIGKEKTVLIIAHRLSTISLCEKVFEVKGGKLSLCSITTLTEIPKKEI